MKYDRLQEIRRLLLRNRKVTTAELCTQFSVSLETVRRDLNTLEREGILQKVYGGAILTDNSDSPHMMSTRDTRSFVCDDEKRRIAARAIDLIPDNAIIALDSGTTVFRLAQLLSRRKGLTVLTNSLDIAAEVTRRTSHMVYCIGGVIKRAEMITTGFLADDFLNRFSSIDMAIFSADGVSPSGGISDYSVEMGTIKQKILAKSERCICLIDHTKYGVDTFYKVCDLHQFDTFIMDDGLPPGARQEIENMGVETIIA